MLSEVKQFSRVSRDFKEISRRFQGDFNSTRTTRFEKTRYRHLPRGVPHPSAAALFLGSQPVTLGEVQLGPVGSCGTRENMTDSDFDIFWCHSIRRSCVVHFKFSESQWRPTATSRRALWIVASTGEKWGQKKSVLDNLIENFREEQNARAWATRVLLRHSFSCFILCNQSFRFWLFSKCSCAYASWSLPVQLLRSTVLPLTEAGNWEMCYIILCGCEKMLNTSCFATKASGS